MLTQHWNIYIVGNVGDTYEPIVADSNLAIVSEMKFNLIA